MSTDVIADERIASAAGKTTLVEVLLLEDDANLGFILHEHLQMQGYEVTLCGNGLDGLKAYKGGGFTLCRSDPKARVVLRGVPRIFPIATARRCSRPSRCSPSRYPGQDCS